MSDYKEGTCGACREPIVGDCIRAFGMQWHLDHLVCNVCHNDFSNGTPVWEGNDGFAYCPEHWKKTFCPTCATCKDTITGPVIHALNKSYHPEHFVCDVCRQKIDGQFYPSKEGNPLCEKDYYDQLGINFSDSLFTLRFTPHQTLSIYHYYILLYKNFDSFWFLFSQFSLVFF
jgi:paxillin